MSVELNNILTQFGQQLTKEIKLAIPVVTGKTAGSVEAHPLEGGFEIVGDATIGALIYGRGPTKNSSPGNPTLRESILSWIEAKGIKPEGEITKETLAYLISRKIHREGNSLYRSIKSGGKPNNIFATIITENRINALASLVSNRIALEVTNDITKTIIQ